MKRGGIFLATRLALGLMVVAMVSACAGHENDGSTATLAIPKLPPKVMLEKLDLNVPVDLDVSDLNAATATPAYTAAPSFNALAETRSPDDAARALDCLTQTVYYEAGNQSDDGQRAVAQVVLNRVRDRAFPSSVCGVVYQGSQRSTGCQFTFTCDGSLNRRPSAAGWERARAVASAALAGAVYAPVGSATFYHANYVSPWWASSMDKVATVGAHIFYRWRGGMENALAFRQRYSGAEPSLTGRTAPGSTIAYAGDQSVDGVTIHRGGSPASSPAVAAPASTSAPAIVTTSARLVRVGSMAGIRIHRGMDGPVSTEDLTDKATVD
ncbi:cell wall hydrolase [Sphingomonas sp.]|uniref:cell wall hydrolase n=1 Tax=Sphingomonas sp. TaxID=28214 RepID=UPI002E2FB497|nr:cell wall hydrolase [Sphingomonas sp.]HEX4694507.1 cell wall hydrolase [Sphingomonas sp.]